MLFMYVWYFFSAVFRAASRAIMYCTGDLERISVDRGYTRLEEIREFALGYVHFFLIRASHFIYSYMDLVLTAGALVLLCYVVLRFARNRAFNARDYFKIWIVSFSVLFFGAPVFSIISCFYPEYVPLGFSDFAEISVSLLKCSLIFALMHFAASFLFLKIPFGEDTTWAGEMRAREFLSRNFAYLRSFRRAIWTRDLLGIVLFLAGLDIFRYWLLNV